MTCTPMGAGRDKHLLSLTSGRVLAAAPSIQPHAGPINVCQSSTPTWRALAPANASAQIDRVWIYPRHPWPDATALMFFTCGQRFDTALSGAETYYAAHIDRSRFNLVDRLTATLQAFCANTGSQAAARLT